MAVEDMRKLEAKWQKVWDEAKTFQPEIEKKKKFLCTFPYPYVNGLPHVGHIFSMMRVECIARYKRAQGFNVLFPQGWHATGSPLISAAKRVSEGEEKQISILKQFGVPENKIQNFSQPEYWIEYFAPNYKQDVVDMGVSIDWRREFHTTSINPHYDKFIRWQFNKLKAKGYVAQGTHPVVWDPKEETPVSDHARIQGEGETPQEFVLVLLKREDADEYLATATLRPETIDGVTNVWMNPDVTYVRADVDGKTLIVTAEALEKLEQQDHTVAKKGEISGSELIGTNVITPRDATVPVLPATFLSTDKGSGIVISVPSDAPDDYIALRDIKENEEIQQKFNLDISGIEPIPIIDAKELGNLAGVKAVEDAGIKNQQERKKLEEAKKIVYKKGFYEGTMLVGPYKGKPVEKAKELVRSELLENNHAILFYELTGPVVARSLAQCIVKLVSDQWFITYSDEEWKKITHKALDNMKLYPENSRQQFDYVIDWLNDWACTRSSGLGTRLPWAEEWLIESLSDSTLYNAYYTFVHVLREISPDEIDDSLFDYVILGQGDAKNDTWKQMRELYQYWYPVDLRNSGKDLIQNHLAFMLFTHTAILPKDEWPKAYGVNGWVTVDGQKMSKSLGNLIPARELLAKYGADASRLTILNGGEGLDDPNWDTELAKNTVPRLERFVSFCEENYGKGRSEEQAADAWFASKMHTVVRDTTEAMENLQNRTAIQSAWFTFSNVIKDYMKLTGKSPHKDLITEAISTQIRLLQPFTPHIAEEAWQKIGGEGLVSEAPWPTHDHKKISPEIEQLLEIGEGTLHDIKHIVQMLQIKTPKKVTLFTPASWKYDFISELKKQLEVTHNPSDIIKHFMSTPMKQFGKTITRLIPTYVRDRGKIPLHPLSEEKERAALEQNLERFTDILGFPVEVVPEDEADHNKAKQAMPGKPAILVE